MMVERGEKKNIFSDQVFTTLMIYQKLLEQQITKKYFTENQKKHYIDIALARTLSL